MAGQKHTAYVLPEDAVATTEAQVFPGFPGVYQPGVPVAVFDLGLTDDEAAKLVKELGLPLKRTTAQPERAEGEMVSGFRANSESLETPAAPVGTAEEPEPKAAASEEAVS